MELKMSVGNKVIASIPLDPVQSKDEKYITAVKRLLFARHQLIIASYRKRPVFYIEILSSMNNPAKA